MANPPFWRNNLEAIYHNSVSVAGVALCDSLFAMAWSMSKIFACAKTKFRLDLIGEQTYSQNDTACLSTAPLVVHVFYG